MNFLTSEIIFYTLISLGVLILISLILNINLALRIKKLMRGKNGSSLEKSFLAMNEDIEELQKFRFEIEKYLKNVDNRLSKSIRGIEAINYNAFSGAESGGKSFAIALINEKGDGIVLSSLHSRDRVNLFSKKITGHKSDIELTEEEKLALTKAKESCNL